MKTARLIFRFQVVLTLTALLLVPLVFSSATISTVLVKSLAMNVLLGCLLALEIFRLGLEGRVRPVATRLSVPVGSYLVWMGLSALWGGVHSTEVAALQKTVFVVLIAYFVAAYGHRLRLVGRVLTVVLSVGAITGAYAILQICELDFFDWWRFEWSLPVRRVCASFGNPTFFAGYLIALIPLALAVREMTRKPLWRQMLLALALLDLVALGLTFSKAGVLATAAALLCWFVLKYSSRLPRRDRSSVVALLMILFSGALVVGSAHRSVAAVDKLSEAIMVSSGGRGEIYQSAARMIRANPVFGVGPGMFGHEIPKYRTPELSLFHPPHKQLLTHAHCEFLEQAAELGIPGLLLFVWIVLTAVRTALGKRKSSPLAAGVVAALVGLLVDSLFSVNLRKEPVLMSFWTLIGLAVYCGSPVPVVRRAQWRPALRLITGCCAVLLAFSVAFVQGRDLIVDLLLRQGGAHLKNNNPGRAGLPLQKAVRLSPKRPEALYWLGSVYYDAGNYDLAIQQFERLLSQHGNYVNTIFNLGTAYAKAGQRQKAIELYQEGLRTDPYYAKMHDYLGRCYFLDSTRDDWQQLASECFEKAAQYYQQQSARNPTDLELLVDRAKVLLFLQRQSEAQDELRKVLELEPNNAQALKLLERMEPSQ